MSPPLGCRFFPGSSCTVCGALFPERVVGIGGGYESEMKDREGDRKSDESQCEGRGEGELENERPQGGLYSWPWGHADIRENGTGSRVHKGFARRPGLRLQTRLGTSGAGCPDTLLISIFGPSAFEATPQEQGRPGVRIQTAASAVRHLAVPLCQRSLKARPAPGSAAVEL